MPICTYTKHLSPSEGPLLVTTLQQLKKHVSEQIMELTSVIRRSASAKIWQQLSDQNTPCASGLLHHGRHCVPASTSSRTVHADGIIQIATGNRQDEDLCHLHGSHKLAPDLLCTTVKSTFYRAAPRAAGDLALMFCGCSVGGCCFTSTS